jgi:hypothetical protein
MAEIKTQKTKESVAKFLAAIEEEEKQKDCKVLLKMFAEATGEKPAMWGDSIIGYGVYHYQSERSKQAGDWFMVGFSPRKQALTIYIIEGVKKYATQLEKLGKHKLSGGSCLYIKRLSDIDTAVLESIIKTSYAAMKADHQ